RGFGPGPRSAVARMRPRLALPACALLCALAACGPVGAGVGADGTEPGGESAARSDVPATAPPPPAPAHIGLLALAAGDGSVRVHWSLPTGTGPTGNWQPALFCAASPEHVVDGAPALSGLTGTSALLTGLETGTA